MRSERVCPVVMAGRVKVTVAVAGVGRNWTPRMRICPRLRVMVRSAAERATWKSEDPPGLVELTMPSDRPDPNSRQSASVIPPAPGTGRAMP
jgi:hypothetical protein